MKKLIQLTTGIIFIFLQFSCRKDTPADTECPDAYVLNTIDINSLGYYFRALGVNSATPTDPVYYYPQNNLITKPVANPSNAFEFIFLKKSTPQAPNLVEELWKYNFCSNTFSILKTGLDGIKPIIDWSNTDWILYSSDNKIFKMKSNGDSVTYLSDNPGYFDLRWSPSGNSYAGYHSANQKVSVFSQTGALLKEYSLYTPKSNLYWINATEILFVGLNDISSININTDNISQLCTGFEYAPVGYNLNTSQLYVLNSTMLAHYNINNCQVDSIVEVNNSKLFFDVKPLGNEKVISLMVVSQWKDSVLNQKNQFYHLLLMNPDGSNQRVISID